MVNIIICYFTLRVCLYYVLLLLSLDNSEWMINGDYSATRLEAQNDAGLIMLFCHAFCAFNSDRVYIQQA